MSSLLYVLAAIVVMAILADCIHQSLYGVKPHYLPKPRPEPLSDEEFLARCSPGVKPEVALRVRDIVSDQLSIPPEGIYPEHRFVEDLGAW